MADKIKIEHNVPLPERMYTNGRTDVLRTLEIGDSFEVPFTKRASYMMLATRLKKEGRFFISRKTSDTTARIWRVKQP